MNADIVCNAIKNRLLRKAELPFLRTGDEVMVHPSLAPDINGLVLALHGGKLIIGWSDGDVVVLSGSPPYNIYLSPLCWVEDKPVYEGDTLYLKENDIGPCKVVCMIGDKIRCCVSEYVYHEYCPSEMTLVKIIEKTILINGYDVPEPMRIAPVVYQTFWTPCMTSNSRVISITWNDTASDRNLLARGMVHLTYEAARIHATALESFTK